MTADGQVRQIDTVFISSYTYLHQGRRTNQSGPVIPLLDFFSPRARRVYLVEQPLPGSSTLDVRLTCVENGRPAGTRTVNFFFSRNPGSYTPNRTSLLLKVRDVLSNAYFAVRLLRDLRRAPHVLFIGVECVNALCGVLLRLFGVPAAVVYLVFDWAPDRYPGRLMNRLYLWMDRMATYHADSGWNITYTIADARQKLLGYDQARMCPQLYVPYCVDFRSERVRAEAEVDSALVIYAGSLIEENGPQILLAAFRQVLERSPGARLLVIGGGHDEALLRDYVGRHGLSHAVTITGYIADQEEVMRLQSQGAIGVAPYPIQPGSRKPYGDVIKVRMYFATGLVTVTTPVPPVWREIEAEHLGVVTPDDSPEQLARGILSLLEDPQRLFQYRRNVIDKAMRSSWEANYSRALQAMGLSSVPAAGGAAGVGEWRRAAAGDLAT